ncbi:MAG: B12-binding domain-containing radical SAM protein [Oligoflexales bacterium]|nr:B12-binding domain-containing radical SAM protein [Oligoflexales bacterium]
MKIIFVRPNMINERQSDAMEPLAFAVLSALTPDDIETNLYDDRVEEIDYDDKCDLVAISVETFTAKRAYNIALEYRKRNIPVIMGGFHTTFLPEESLMFADSVVVGDAEISWPQVIADLRKGSLKRMYQNTVTSLDNIEFSRRIFENKPYNKISPVQFSRGCKHHCDFCSVKAFYGKNLMQRPLDEVVKEIENIKNRYIFFADDNLFFNPKIAKELFQRLTSLGVKWACQMSLDVAKNEELLILMRKSGCISALIGFESLDVHNLMQMKKSVNTRYEYKDIVKKFNNNGIMLFGTFVIGYDFDTRESFEKTLDFAIESKMCLAQFNPLMPMPGTTLYEKFRSEGRLIYDKWWLDPEYRYGKAMFVPKNMTPDELSEGIHDIRIKFNKYSSIIKRSFSKANAGNLSNLMWYTVTNLVTKREILRKNNRILGI